MVQTWDPVRYRRDAHYVATLALPATDLLDPQPGERILDLGCGDGALTLVLAEAGAEVVGVDASPDLVAAAQQRGLDVRLGDGRGLEAMAADSGWFGAFDAVFSNAALHWMEDLERVTRGVRRLLKPGGRFVGEFGGEGNVATVVSALTAALWRRGVDAAAFNPWVFPSASAFERLLWDNGFTACDVKTFERPTDLPGDLAQWLNVFAGPFLAAVDPQDHASLIDEVIDGAGSLRGADGIWRVDYVRLRHRAVAAPEVRWML